MNWPKPILTDSGGYQVFSLAKLNNISDKGVEFKNPRDGSHVFYHLESNADSNDLGSDVAMAFDHCPPHTSNENDIEESLKELIHGCKNVLRLISNQIKHYSE